MLARKNLLSVLRQQGLLGDATCPKLYSSVCKPKRVFDIVKIEDGHVDRVLKFLRKHYYRNEPLLRMQRVKNPPSEVDGYYSQLMNQGYSLIATDKETSEIAGVALNIDPAKKCPYCFKDEKIRRIVHFLGDLHHGIDLSRSFKTNKWLAIELLFVKSEFKRNELGTQLVCETKKIADECQLRGIWAYATTCEAQRFYKEIGFQRIAELCYKNYLSENDIWFCPEAPNMSGMLLAAHITQLL